MRAARIFNTACTCLAVGVVLALGAARAQADDRPFVQTSHAVAEDDDEGNWSLETWWLPVGSRRVFNLAPEYAFSPYTTLQFRNFVAQDRLLGERSVGVETEFKHLFNHLGRDGFGWGVHVSLTVAREGEAAFQVQSLAAKWIGTLNLLGGDAKLHLNGGLNKVRAERREWIGSLVLEHKLPWRSTAFFELGREDRENLLHAGVRHWVRRDKMAVDFSAQQQRLREGRARGLVLGLAWYDL